MFSHIGGAEILIVALLGLVGGLLPIVLAIWVVVTLTRIQRTVDRIAAALDHSAAPPPRVR